MIIAICLVTSVVFWASLSVLMDIWFDYCDVQFEEQLAGQRERFGISEDTQGCLIDDFGYPEYIEKLRE